VEVTAVTSSAPRHHPAPAGPDAEPVALDDNATAIRDAYKYIREFEAARPDVTVRRPWSHGNHSPRWVIQAPGGTTQTCATVTAVRDALERDYPPPAPEAGTS
jgi:hypothetical protein